jgi:pSer/pThr/pTyr-binding forkhead associated (FHA) protein
VVPKAPSFSAEDEDDKTTIESGWEEEASTTVEQGDVAERIRALALLEPKRRSGTNITSTDGGELPDEPTVDDQRANATLAKLPPPAVAKLVITAGNDSGQSLEVRPGKTYTIGRGIANDLVLTDLTVSRKHFELHYENSAWILVDQESGNGTAINDRIEAGPYVLENAATIEAGTTAFTFDVTVAPPSISSLPREGSPETPAANAWVTRIVNDLGTLELLRGILRERRGELFPDDPDGDKIDRLIGALDALQH